MQLRPAELGDSCPSYAEPHFDADDAPIRDFPIRMGRSDPFQLLPDSHVGAAPGPCPT
jgi:hypothetical protein